MRRGTRARRVSRAAATRKSGARWAGTSKGWRVTVNMLSMYQTLDMSKLSGWLKAHAERNMPFMSPTLDVSKLSGWLKADAESNMLPMSTTLDVSKLSVAD